MPKVLPIFPPTDLFHSGRADTTIKVRSFYGLSGTKVVKVGIDKIVESTNHVRGVAPIIDILPGLLLNPACKAD